MARYAIARHLGKTNMLTEIPQDIKWDLDSLNVTAVGTQKVSNGVVSGFSADVYMKTPSIFKPETKTWEIVFKASHNGKAGLKPVLGFTSGSEYSNVAICVNTENKFCAYASSNGTAYDILNGASNALGTTTIPANVDYFYKLAFDGASYIGSISTNGIEWTQEFVVDSSSVIKTPTTVSGIGISIAKSTYTWDGTIDISQSYIKIDNEIWWKGGTGNLTLRAGSKLYLPNGKNEDGTKRFDIINIEEDVVANNFTGYSFLAHACYLPSHNKVVLDTIYTGSGNGFEYDDDNNYFRMKGTYTDSTMSEKQIALPLGLVTMDSTIGASKIEQVFNDFGYIGSTIFALPSVRGVSPNGFEADGSLRDDVWSTDRVITRTLASNHNVSSAILAFNPNEPVSGYLIGVLNQSDYIYKFDENRIYNKATGDEWRYTPIATATVTNGVVSDFKPKKVGEGVVRNKLHTLAKRRRDYYKYGTELNATVVGSPTIVDGVASGFTTANYLTTPKVFNPLGSEVECVFKINLTALARFNPMLCQSGSVQFHKFSFSVWKDGRIRFYAGNGSTTIVNIYSNVVLEINKDYWLKLHIKDNVYSLYYSLDGKDYIFDNSVTDTDTIREMTAVAAIGAQRDPATGSSSYFTGSIDLRESYVKINGEDWWHGTKIVKTTEDDHEWYVDRNVAYDLVYKPYEVISQTFNVSDELQTYVVPEDVSRVNVVCVASRGGNTGGNGGYVKCDLSVTAGQTLYVMVGGIPTSTYTASYNASDIRIGGTEYANRVIVAGGGGSKSSRGALGGAGGGLTGADGGKGYGGSSMGKGGTQTAGGAGGSGTAVDVGHYHHGKAGTFGLGGTGSHDGSYEGDAGAGGAGWYGGGSGAGDWNKNGGYVAGGGGGSSYTDNTLCSNVVHIQGNNSGDGYVKISYVKELKK